jgi:hypothetical protein
VSYEPDGLMGEEIEIVEQQGRKAPPDRHRERKKLAKLTS